MGRYLVRYREFTFKKIGITLASFEDSEKIPVIEDWFMSLEIEILIVLKYLLRSLVGILFGPIDFFRFNFFIISSTSSGDVGVKEKVFSDEFVR